MATQFIQLNEGWNADPNASENEYAVEGVVFWLRFQPNRFQFETERETGDLFLRFEGCHSFRFTSINDHGFYLGQCRFSQSAPAWGEFYEIVGDFQEEKDPTPWQRVDASEGPLRNFLFYTRDETVEVKAVTWDLLWDAPQLDFVTSRTYARKFPDDIMSHR